MVTGQASFDCGLGGSGWLACIVSCALSEHVSVVPFTAVAHGSRGSRIGALSAPKTIELPLRPRFLLQTNLHSSGACGSM